MIRIIDINNRIEDHIILSKGEISTVGFTLGFDEHRNMNMSTIKVTEVTQIFDTI
jgi:hypothetical protein